jgi:hypothetical protein
MSLGSSAATAVWPRSETPSAPAHAEASLGEGQPVAAGAADAVVRLPPFPGRIHPALEDQVLDGPAAPSPRYPGDCLGRQPRDVLEAASTQQRAPTARTDGRAR